MKTSISIVLVVVFSLSSLTRVYTIIDFKIHQDHIAKTLCVEKDIERSSCNGKCHLSKKLNKQATEEEKQAPNSSKKRAQILYADFNEYILKNNLEFKSEYKALFTYKSFKTNNSLKDIFHPPEVS